MDCIRNGRNYCIIMDGDSDIGLRTICNRMRDKRLHLVLFQLWTDMDFLWCHE